MDTAGLKSAEEISIKDKSGHQGLQRFALKGKRDMSMPSKSGDQVVQMFVSKTEAALINIPSNICFPHAGSALSTSLNETAMVFDIPNFSSS